MTGREGACEGERTGRKMLGLFFIGLGTVLLLRTLGVLDLHILQWLGPVLLIGVGLLKLVRGRRPAGVWLLGLGVLLALHKSHAVAFGEAWPYLMVIAGLALVVDALVPHRGSAAGAP